MLKRLIFGIAMLYFNTAPAEIKLLTDGGQKASSLRTYCIEGYVVLTASDHLAPNNKIFALQMLNDVGEPLRCKGEKHPAIID